MVSSCARDCQTVRLPGQVQPGEGARPAWFWWGWSCKRTSGTPGFAVAAAGEQVTAHLGGIAAAIAAGDRLWRQRLSYAVTAATLLPALGVLHDLADLIDKGADLDEVVTKARTVLRTRSGLITEALDRQGGRTIDVTGWSRAVAEVEQAADVLTAVSHLVPLVLVIDDAHDLDPDSLQLLATLRQRRLVGLIVLTACTRSPDREVVEGEFARWLSELAGQGRVERHRLARLDLASMAKIAADEMPEVSDPGALAVVTECADGNPLALRELLRLPAVQDAVRTGRDLAGLLPRLHPEGDLSHLYEAAWTALPVQARRVLALAGVFGQTTCEPWLLEAAAPVLSADQPADPPDAVVSACVEQHLGAGDGHD